MFENSLIGVRSEDKNFNSIFTSLIESAALDLALQMSDLLTCLLHITAFHINTKGVT